MQLSLFGQKFTSRAGILQLMDDLGRAMVGDDAGYPRRERPIYMLGGGNPARIPAVEERIRAGLLGILDSDNGAVYPLGERLERMIGCYDAPRGEPEFRAALASLLRRTYGWDVGPNNVALTNGSQTLFFFLFNMLAGEFADGVRRQILLPLAPEYIGYADQGLTPDLFVAAKPGIDFEGEHTFKYRVNFDAISLTNRIGAICVSRPTNPTGNVLTDAEITQLHRLARGHGIPLIIDNAYGMPFPGIIFSDIRPVWDEDIILCMSLSKLGLPGVRTGIVIARHEVIEAISALNAIISLAPSSVGPGLTLDLVRSGEIIRLSREVIMPFYRHKSAQASAWFQDELDGYDYFVHRSEGAIFLWVWFRELPITCLELYERLKQRGVIVVPGHYFYPGLEEQWQHKHECIRVNYAGDGAVVREGIRIIGQEVRRTYDQGQAVETIREGSAER